MKMKCNPTNIKNRVLTGYSGSVTVNKFKFKFVLVEGALPFWTRRHWKYSYLHEWKLYGRRCGHCLSWIWSRSRWNRCICLGKRIHIQSEESLSVALWMPCNLQVMWSPPLADPEGARPCHQGSRFFWHAIFSKRRWHPPMRLSSPHGNS